MQFEAIFLHFLALIDTFIATKYIKLLYKKTVLFLASMGETGLTHDIFFEFSLRPFEVVEAEGGRLVMEADFEAESFFLLKQII
jgi:hypothetical protein